MPVFRTLDHHAELVARMAETLGVDLGQAILDRRIDGQGLRSAVVACCACEAADACPGWMDAQATPAPEAPDYCRNRDRLAALKPR